MKMKGITQKDLMVALAKVNGCGFAGIDAKTKVDLTGGKKNPMQGRVTKFVTGANVMLFSNKTGSGYENKVKRELEKEGLNPDDFQLGKLPWGERIPETPLIMHKGELYVQVIYRQKPTGVQYFLDDEPIAKEDIIGLPEKEKKEGYQGGLVNKVIVRTYMLENIKKLKMGKNSVGA